jgi:hypothetical protein
MDFHAAIEEVAQWCAQQTAKGDPEEIEVASHAIVCITISESAPPWHVRRRRRCSSGAGAPMAQLRYDFESDEWALHHGGRGGWCADEDASHAREVGPLLDEVGSDRAGRFVGLPPGFRWPFGD